MNREFVRALLRNHAWLTGVVILLIYAVTIAPNVMHIDSGELAAVQLTLGIAHPTGYPLFTVLGYIFSHLPMPVAQIAKMNILAAVWCAMGIVMFIYTAELILSNLSLFGIEKKNAKESKKKKKKSQDEAAPEESKSIVPALSVWLVVFTAISGGFILALNRTYWMQSTSVEVYSLHALLIISVIFFLLKAYLNKYEEEPNDINWYIFSFVLALSFSNHMTSILILPGVAYLYFTSFGFNKSSFARIGRMLFIFFTTLVLVYSYLPIRALQGPMINWGNPVTFDNIIRHISGKQYQVWIFSSTAAAKKQLTYFFSQIPVEFTLNLVFIVAGVIYSFFAARKIFTLFIITFVSTVAYSINYDIKDIDSYFLLAFISMAVFAIFGLLLTYKLLRDKRLKYILPIVLVTVFTSVQFYVNFEEVDQSDNLTFKDYTQQILLTTGKNGLILSYQWDFFISPSYYFQNVDRMRTDVKIIDKELLRRSWYFEQLDNYSPKLMATILPEREQFLRLLAPFEQETPYDANALELSYRNLMKKMVENSLGDRPVYISMELAENEMKRGEFVLPEGCTLIPDVFFYRVVRDNKYYEASLPAKFLIRFPKQMTYYHEFIYKTTASMLTQRIVYEMQFNKTERAKIYFNRLKENFPDYPLPKGLAESLK